MRKAAKLLFSLFLLPAILFQASRSSFASSPAPAMKAKTNLVGTVVDENKAPVNGATVYIYTAGARTGYEYLCPSCFVECGMSAQTNSSGLFHIDGVDKSLVYRVLLIHPGFKPTFADHVDPLDHRNKLTIDSVPAEALDPSHLVVGRVVDSNGNPVLGATAEPVGIDWHGHGAAGMVAMVYNMDPIAVTDKNGIFRLYIQDTSATLTLRVKSRALAPKIVKGMAPRAPNPIDIQLSDGSTVEGLVVDANKNLAPGIAVRVSNSDGSGYDEYVDTGTDSQGRFAIYNLPSNGHYAIYIPMDSAKVSGKAIASQTFVTGGNDSTSAMPELQLSDAGIVSGKLTFSDGKSNKGLTVIVSRADAEFDASEALTAADGTYNFNCVPIGEPMYLSVGCRGYHIDANTPNYDPGIHAISFTMGKSTPKLECDITMVPNDPAK